MDKEYILASQLSYKIGSQPILRSIDFAIARGDCVAIVGANGCGKSTLLRMLCGLLHPSSGTLAIAGLNHNKISQSLILRKIIGFAPDQPPLYPNDTVYSYLRFRAQLLQIATSDINERIDTLLEQFTLQQYKHKRLGTLSKGTQQRVNLAQAVLQQPQILLLDEPSNALDQEQCETLCNFIKQLRQQQITTLIATHNYSEIIPLCDYMLRINDSQVNKVVTPLATIPTEHTHDQPHYST